MKRVIRDVLPTGERGGVRVGIGFRWGGRVVKGGGQGRAMAHRFVRRGKRAWCGCALDFLVAVRERSGGARLREPT